MATYNGNNSGNTYTGTGSADQIYGNGGSDNLSGGSGTDLIYGGTSNDSLYGGNDNDTLSGDDGNDRIDGGSGNDSALGGIGSDSITGAAGNDTLDGGDNNDTLDGGDNDDLLLGGAGSDTLYGGSGTGNDSLFGGTGTDRLEGGDGNDSLSGGAENDSLYAGNGDDTLEGGAGADVLNGGAGMDFADYSASGAAVNVNLNTWTATGGDATGDALSGVDGLIGSSFDDTLIGFNQEGTSGADIFTNVFYGGGGNDFISGLGGDDSLFGGDDDDTVDGGDGADAVDGGAGNDSLLGGAGSDTLTGGDGADVLIGGDGGDVLDGGAGVDTLYAGLGDTIYGGSSGGDVDVLDLTSYGWDNVAIHPDSGNPLNGTIDILDDDGNVIGTLTYYNIEQLLVCFALGTRILTDRGEVAVEALCAGDLVQTRDHGLQPLRWVGRRDLSLAQTIAAPKLRPVRIAAGALGPGRPGRDLTVSPQHRMLIEGGRAELLFDDAEVLVPALHLLSLPGVERLPPRAVSYFHLLFDRHEIVLSEGAWSESFQPAERTISDLEAAQRQELFALFPELSQGVIDYPAARATLKAHEARVLLAS